MPRTQQIALTTSTVATNFGTQYIDIPVNGTIVGISLTSCCLAGAGQSYAYVEVSRQGVDQTGVTNPKGVLHAHSFANPVISASHASATPSPVMYEPVRVGERLYLNAKIVGTNLSSHISVAVISIQTS